MKNNIDIDEEGEILLEWHRKETSGHSSIFSIILNNTGLVFSLLKNGERTNYYGHIGFSENNIETLQNAIKEWNKL